MFAQFCVSRVCDHVASDSSYCLHEWNRMWPSADEARTPQGSSGWMTKIQVVSKSLRQTLCIQFYYIFSILFHFCIIEWKILLQTKKKESFWILDAKIETKRKVCWRFSEIWKEPTNPCPDSTFILNTYHYNILKDSFKHFFGCTQNFSPILKLINWIHYDSFRAVRILSVQNLKFFSLKQNLIRERRD